MEQVTRLLVALFGTLFLARIMWKGIRFLGAHAIAWLFYLHKPEARRRLIRSVQNGGEE